MEGTRKVRIAVVGLGFGRQWVPNYRDLPDVEYVGICDVDANKVKHVGEEFGIERRHASLDEVLASDAYDAVHLLTPIPLHVEQSLAVLASGKHCACAIPMAMTMDEVKSLIRAQRASGKNYMLMETEIYSRTFLYAQKLHAEGAFGELQFLRGMHYQNMEGWPDYWQGLPPMYYSSHGLGPAFYLIGKRASKVHCTGSGRLPEALQQAYGNPFPVESALFQFEDSYLTCEVTCCLFQMARGFLVDRFHVYGDKLGMEAAQLPGDGIALFEVEQGPLKPGQRGRNAKADRTSPPPLAELVAAEIQPNVRESHNPRCIAIAHEFIRSIVEERPPTLDVITAADWTAANICAHESALQGGEGVQIPRFA